MQQVSYYTVLYPHIYDLNNLLGQDSMGILHILLRKKSFIRPVKIHNLESDQLMLLNDFLLMKFHFNVNSYYKPLCTSKAYVYIYISLLFSQTRANAECYFPEKFGSFSECITCTSMYLLLYSLLVIILYKYETNNETFKQLIYYFFFNFVKGNFTVAFGSVAGEKFQLLTTIPDEGEKSLTLYTAQVKIP